MDLRLDGCSNVNLLVHAVMDDPVNALSVREIGNHFWTTVVNGKGADSSARLSQV